MLEVLPQLLEIIVVGAIALVAGYYLKQSQVKRQIQLSQEEGQRIITEAETQAKEKLLQAKDEGVKVREEAVQEAKRRQAELQVQEQRFHQRREKLDRRFDQIESRARNIEQREKRLRHSEEELEEIRRQRLAELERVAHMAQDQARELLLNTVREESRQDMARIIREVEQEIREEADRRVREILVTTMQRCASDQVAEAVISSVPLPNDDMKGRIIGRQGRNIRTIEQLTGVDIIVDDTPDAIMLSCFDPVRREVARLSLHKLIQDGRIHPARIEKIVKKTQEEVEAIIREEGEKAAIDARVPGLHPEIIKLLGRMKYRTSYGQNVLAHSVETAHLAAMIAAELGADPDVARAGALLHDLGKAVSHEVDGSHALIGAEIARRYGVPPKVVNCIASHHHDEEQTTVEAIIVETADAISGARPGARRETLEVYTKRIKALEGVANSFAGVHESFALQAGRELRIVVKPEEIDDLASIQLSRDIAKSIEESLEYPGQIKVTVIRETRAVGYAK
ncbi:MAG: ribonuclease Y [Chloroflexi bacterium RBG_16_57_9]|nr:MAG: ribonuclease Y [Chloroflexi bacterium RBG_16_57_9]